MSESAWETMMDYYSIGKARMIEEEESYYEEEEEDEDDE